MLRRLRAWPVSSWRHGDRTDRTREALHAVAALAAAARGNPAPAVPDVGPHALADQVVVLLADARAAGAPAGEIDRVMAALLVDLGGG